MKKFILDWNRVVTPLKKFQLLNLQENKTFCISNGKRLNHTNNRIVVFPEMLENRIKILEHESILSNLQSSAPTLQSTLDKQNLNRMGKEDKIQRRQERLARKKLRFQSSQTQSLGQSQIQSQKSQYVYEKEYPRSLYSAYLYSRQLRIARKEEQSWSFIHETLFEGFLGMKSELFALLLDHVTEDSREMMENNELNLFRTHQALFFIECLKMLEIKREFNLTLEFLGQILNEDESTHTFHPILNFENVWCQLFHLGSELQNEQIFQLIYNSWNTLSFNLDFLKKKSSLKEFIRFFVTNGQSETISKLLINHLRSHPDSLKYLNILFSELLHLSSNEHASLVNSINLEIINIENNLGKNLHTAETYSYVLQAFIDLGDIESAEKYFEQVVKEKLYYGVQFRSDSLLLTMPLSFAYIESQSWDKLSTFMNDYLLERSVDILHPDELYIAALAFNQSELYTNTVKLFQKYSSEIQNSHNWKTTIELMKAFGELKQFEICNQLLFNCIRDISQLEENSEILSNYTRVLLKNGLISEVSQTIAEYNSVSECKKLGLVHVPSNSTILYPIIEYQKEDPASVLYILRELWPNPLADPSKLISLIQSIANNTNNLPTKERLEEYCIQLELERNQFLNGEILPESTTPSNIL